VAILQALFAYLARSTGTIANAIFGWAVTALFGRTSKKEQTMLSVLVGTAAVWPLLLLGIAFPKIATLVIGFIPLSNKVPSAVVRPIWIVASALVPLAVGLGVAMRAPPRGPREAWWLRLLRGFPITLGLSSAFFLMFVTVPVLRAISAVRGRRDEHVPCILTGDEYDAVALHVEQVLHGAGFELSRSEPSWWLSGPSKVLLKLGGKALRGMMPERLAYWQGPHLEVAFYPSDVLVRGERGNAAYAHGLLAEQLARGPGLQTFDAAAQELERELRAVWRLYEQAPHPHRASRVLVRRLQQISAKLATLPLDYDDWQVVYRQAAQVGRAISGQTQLLESLNLSPETIMNDVRQEGPHPLAGTPTQQLVSRLMQESKHLVQAEIALARAELKEDVKREVHMVSGLSVAAICALCTLNMLLVACAFALSLVLPGWAAALIVAAAVLVVGTVAGIIGWAMRAKAPLHRTVKTLKEDVQWAKERIA